jgi:hypothetical protein
MLLLHLAQHSVEFFRHRHTVFHDANLVWHVKSIDLTTLHFASLQSTAPSQHGITCCPNPPTFLSTPQGSSTMHDLAAVGYPVPKCLHLCVCAGKGGSCSLPLSAPRKTARRRPCSSNSSSSGGVHCGASVRAALRTLLAAQCAQEDSALAALQQQQRTLCSKCESSTDE